MKGMLPSYALVISKVSTDQLTTGKIYALITSSFDDSLEIQDDNECRSLHSRMFFKRYQYEPIMEEYTVEDAEHTTTYSMLSSLSDKINEIIDLTSAPLARDNLLLLLNEVDLQMKQMQSSRVTYLNT